MRIITLAVVLAAVCVTPAHGFEIDTPREQLREVLGIYVLSDLGVGERGIVTTYTSVCEGQNEALYLFGNTALKDERGTWGSWEIRRLPGKQVELRFLDGDRREPGQLMEAFLSRIASSLLSACDVAAARLVDRPERFRIVTINGAGSVSELLEDFRAATAAPPTLPPEIRAGEQETMEAVTDGDGRKEAAYIEKVRLYDVQAKYFSGLLDGEVPGVRFKLQNTGERTLDRVRVTFYFQDALGNVIAEQRYTPVNVGGIMSRDPPLRPNYIWQMERGKFYPAPNVPSEWEEGAATAEVTEVNFSKD